MPSSIGLEKHLVKNIALTLLLSDLASSALHPFRTLAGISSGPVALSGCRFLRSFLMSLVLKVILSLKHDVAC